MNNEDQKIVKLENQISSLAKELMWTREVLESIIDEVYLLDLNTFDRMVSHSFVYNCDKMLNQSS